jgi:hypothetical protein
MSHFNQCVHYLIKHLDLDGTHTNNLTQSVIAHLNSTIILHRFISAKQIYVNTDMTIIQTVVRGN